MANEVITLSKYPVIVRALHGAVTLAGAALNWNVGDEIEGATSGAKAIILEIINPGATQTLRFRYIESSPGVYTVFNGSEAINNNTDTGTSTGSNTLTVEASDLANLKSIKGYPRTSPKVKIVIGSGSNIQFVVNGSINADSPVYAAAAVVELSIPDGGVLSFLADVGLATFELTF